MLTFNKKYFILTILLLITEVLIALYVHDNFIRPYIGDLLVVILMYCFCKFFLKIPTIPLAISVLIFAYIVEMLQYINIVKWLGWGNSKLANIVIGNAFSWQDILCYTIGIAIVFWCEKICLYTTQTKP